MSAAIEIVEHDGRYLVSYKGMPLNRDEVHTDRESAEAWVRDVFLEKADAAVRTTTENFVQARKNMETATSVRIDFQEAFTAYLKTRV
jgi:hypothetical protein